MKQPLSGLFTYRVSRDSYDDICRLLQREPFISSQDVDTVTISVTWSESRVLDRYLNTEP